jgi:hypothetical protein
VLLKQAADFRILRPWGAGCFKRDTDIKEYQNPSISIEPLVVLNVSHKMRHCKSTGKTLRFLSTLFVL